MLIKKIDKLILVPFLGLFMLTLVVAIFIMLIQFFLIWFDELIGKDLGLAIYIQLFGYFGITATPKAFPLAILLASLITLGNLGESLELTALKSAGTSLIRILWPLIALVSLLSILVFFSNNYFVPKVTVKAYNLLYDLKKKKPSIAIKEGFFYNGIPDYSIRVEKKLPDQKTLLDIVIYDHSKEQGNVALTTAESGQLYTIHNDRYLVVELFNGHNYIEEPEKSEQEKIPSFYRTSFKTQKLLLDLDEFILTRSSQDLFTYHHTTKTGRELQINIDAIASRIQASQAKMSQGAQQYMLSLTEEEKAAIHEPNKLDSLVDIPNFPDLGPLGTSTWLKNTLSKLAEAQKMMDGQGDQKAFSNISSEVIQQALIKSRNYQDQVAEQARIIQVEVQELREYQLEKQQRLASALGCFIMLLIGAPLGALIKKGGLGVPLLISTVFILLYYIADIFGVRYAKSGLIDSFTGAWMSNYVLLPFGLFFLRQAQKDSRLLDKEAYTLLIQRLMGIIRKK